MPPILRQPTAYDNRSAAPPPRHRPTHAEEYPHNPAHPAAQDLPYTHMESHPWPASNATPRSYPTRPKMRCRPLPRSGAVEVYLPYGFSNETKDERRKTKD